MVQIDAQTVGVIIEIQKETFQVLNMHGKVVSMRSRRRGRRRLLQLRTVNRMLFRYTFLQYE